MILLFGLVSLVIAIEWKSGLWAALSAVGFAAPALVLRFAYPALMTEMNWGKLPEASRCALQLANTETDHLIGLRTRFERHLHPCLPNRQVAGISVAAAATRCQRRPKNV